MALFKSVSRNWKTGPLLASRVKVLSRAKRKMGILIVSVPSSCGNSVKRNRFRRIVRAYIFSRWNGVEDKLWIRLSGKYRLNNPILIEDWKEPLEEVLRALT